MSVRPAGVPVTAAYGTGEQPGPGPHRPRRVALPFVIVTQGDRPGGEAVWVAPGGVSGCASLSVGRLPAEGHLRVDDQPGEPTDTPQGVIRACHQVLVAHAQIPVSATPQRVSGQVGHVVVDRGGDRASTLHLVPDAKSQFRAAPCPGIRSGLWIPHQVQEPDVKLGPGGKDRRIVGFLRRVDDQFRTGVFKKVAIQRRQP